MAAKSRIVTMTVVRKFDEEHGMIVKYGKDTYMVEYIPGVKVGEGVEFEVTPRR